MSESYDVLIIGGGPAGLSAAMSLGRMKRTALVCDDKRPRNLASLHANNLPGNDGINPAELRAKIRTELEKYKTIKIEEVSVLKTSKHEKGFETRLSNGRIILHRKLILAHGITDQLPAIEGVREGWGKNIFHCPFCHGFEHMGQKIGLIGDGEVAVHMYKMARGLSKDLTLYTNGECTIPDEERKGMKIDQRKIKSLKELDCQAYMIILPFPIKMKSSVGEEIGCEKTKFGTYKVDERNRTTVPGVYAGGDIMHMAHSVMLACASGQFAGATAVGDLLAEEFI